MNKSKVVISMVICSTIGWSCTNYVEIDKSLAEHEYTLRVKEYKSELINNCQKELLQKARIIADSLMLEYFDQQSQSIRRTDITERPDYIDVDTVEYLK